MKPMPLGQHNDASSAELDRLDMDTAASKEPSYA
jgi:hypothetical protein